MSDELSAGEGLTVLTPLDGGNIQPSDANTRVMTPNGDGINDVGILEFTVLRINTDRAVGVDLYDVTGRLVRRLRETRELANGLYRMEWDGRDEDGKLVTPGIYIVRYEVDADARDSKPTGLISVAY